MYFDFPEHATGQLATMFTNDVRAIHKAFGESLAKLLMAVRALIVGRAISLSASWKWCWRLNEMIDLIQTTNYKDMRNDRFIRTFERLYERKGQLTGKFKKINN